MKSVRIDHMKDIRVLLMEIYYQLFEHFGPQRWWPAETPLEVMIGAVLTQNTAWANVEKAIGMLKEAGPLSVEMLRKMDEEELAQRIRPSGYFRVKARRLKALMEKISSFGNEGLEAFFALPTERMRRELLQVPGIGPETADSIILYAAERPIFVIDAYTRRILARHRIVDEGTSYDELQHLFMDHLPEDVNLYNEFHALFVALGKVYCRPQPRCIGCPLEAL